MDPRDLERQADDAETQARSLRDQADTLDDQVVSLRDQASTLSDEQAEAERRLRDAESEIDNPPTRTSSIF